MPDPDYYANTTSSCPAVPEFSRFVPSFPLDRSACEPDIAHTDTQPSRYSSHVRSTYNRVSCQSSIHCTKGIWLTSIYDSISLDYSPSLYTTEFRLLCPRQGSKQAIARCHQAQPVIHETLHRTLTASWSRRCWQNRTSAGSFFCGRPSLRPARDVLFSKPVMPAQSPPITIGQGILWRDKQCGNGLCRCWYAAETIIA